MHACSLALIIILSRGGNTHITPYWWYFHFNCQVQEAFCGQNRQLHWLGRKCYNFLWIFINISSIIIYAVGWHRKTTSHTKGPKWLRFLTHKKNTLQWRHNGRDGVSNHQPDDCLLNRLFRRRPKKTSKLRVAGLCGGNSPVTGGFSSQRANNAQIVSIWWRHQEFQ